ncbi:MAG: signal peptidase II [Dethiobacter sp.]|nr:signal peptidase II [Dethiobacter sp.]MBS4054131.1 signal peptidase II [Thermaerobacter sp.]
MIAAFLLSLGILLLDQVSKHLVVLNLSYGESLPIWPGFLALTHVHNFGAAFGLFAGQRWLFFVAVFVTMAVLFMWRKDILRAGPLALWSCALLLGGALGNFLDRLRLGFVVDFIDLGFWPVFNVADSAIVVGALTLAIVTIRAEFK